MILILQKLSNATSLIVTNQKKTVLNLRIKMLGRNNLSGMRRVHNGYADFLASRGNK